MKVGTKLFLALAFPIVFVMAGFAYLDQRRSADLLREELAREGRAVARTTRAAIEDYLRDQDLADVRDLVEQITGYERVLGVRVFDAAGTVRYQSSTLEAFPFTNLEALHRAIGGRKLVETRRTIGKEPVVTFISPLLSPDRRLVGAVQVLQLESFIDEDARASRNFTILLTCVMILATGAILLTVTRVTVGRAVDELVASFREVGSGDLRARVPVRHRDEFAHIAREFNRMCERLEAAQHALVQEHEERSRMEARLRAVEHLAGLGRLAAGLAHEIGTPLNVISGRTEALQRKLHGIEPAERNLGIITAQIDRITRIVREVLDFARGREPKFASTGVPAIVQKVLEFLEQRCSECGVRVETDLQNDLPEVRADADQLHQVFLNLAMNALDAMPDGGILRVVGRVVEQAHPEEPDSTVRPFLEVEFEDTGRGISGQDIDRIFEPFFTTKEVGKGTGLGLSVSYGIVREHGGWMHVSSESGLGSRFTVGIPVTGIASAGAAALDRTA
jgi:two-component system NtrC family sensor kinase